METDLGARVVRAARLVSWLGLISVVTIAPWRYGGVLAVDHLWILALVGIACVALLAAAICDRIETWPQLPMAAWPLAIALLLGLAQLLPLTNSVHATLSQQGHSWWTQWGQDTAAPADTRFPLSLYPASTRHNLAQLAIGVSGFLLASAFSRQRNYLRWTLWIVMANGVATALFGIAQLLTFNGKLYWTVPLTEGGTPFAAFVNRNHAAGYLNLCLAAALGVFAYLLLTMRSAAADQPGNQSNEWVRPAYSNWLVLLAGAACAVIAAAVVCTTSRGGALAGATAFLITAVSTRQLRRAAQFRWFVAAVAVASIALAVWLGGGAELQNRWQAIWTADGPQDGRLAHWTDTLQASRDFWMTGSGLGTYRFAYRPYESGFRDGLFFHAENQYLEALLEGGWLGITLLCGALYCAYRAIRRRRGQEPTPLTVAVGTAGWFAIIAQSVHAFFDFGLYLPANATLFGLLIGTAGCRRESTTTKHSARPWAVLAVGLTAWIAWGGNEFLQVYHFEQTQREFSAAARRLPDHPEMLNQLAVQSFPISADFAEARLLTADVQLAQYQASAFADLREASPQAAASMLWAIADSRSLHQRCHQLLAAGETAPLEQLRLQPAVQQYIGAAYDDLRAARSSCPLLPRAHLGLAQLGVVRADEQYELARLETAQRTAPFAPEVSFQIGLLHLQAGRTELGFAQWNRCLLLSPRYIDQIMTLAARLISTGELIERVLPSSAERLVQIADRYFAGAEAAGSRTRLAAKAERVLAGDDQLLPKRRMALTGHIHRLRGEHEAAIRELTAAVALAPRDVGSRYQLAQLLLQSNLLREAQHHATICQRLDAGPQKYRDLLSRIQQQLRNDLSSSD